MERARAAAATAWAAAATAPAERARPRAVVGRVGAAAAKARAAAAVLGAASFADEGLQENAKDVGQYLKRQLLELKLKNPIFEDVRGEGLFLGIEIVDLEKDKTPHPILANYIVNKMRDKSILLSVDGPKKNIIKIKPPLPFNKENADFLVENFYKVLLSL